MTKQISDERKVAFYIGSGMMVMGGLMFFSTFVTFALNFGDFSDFESDAKSGMFRAFGGMFLLVVGGMIRGAGARGLAGSGILLEPEQAREELEPYSRMAGGMLKDTLDAADVNVGAGSSEQVIMIKCRKCTKLNEEDSKFCQECGKAL